MTNFDFLLEDKQFSSFASVAVAAEQLLHVDVDSCVLSCRRAMEFAVKWMYSVDADLHLPYDDTLAVLMSTEDFRGIANDDVLRRMTFVRKLGNNAAHTGRKITLEQAELCLENLFYFMDFVACLYAKTYTARAFDKSLLTLTPEEALAFVPDVQIDLAALVEENKTLKAELTARRAEQQQSYVPKPL